MNEQNFQPGDQLLIVQADSCVYGVTSEMKNMTGCVVTVIAATLNEFHWWIRVAENEFAWDETNVQKIEFADTSLLDDLL